MNDSLAVIAPADTAIGPPSATARRLVDASVSANTRRAYAGALRRLDAWLNGRLLDDVSLSPPTSPSSMTVAVARGRLDGAIAGLLFMSGMRRSEVSALRWSDGEAYGSVWRSSYSAGSMAASRTTSSARRVPRTVTSSFQSGFTMSLIRPAGTSTR